MTKSEFINNLINRQHFNILYNYHKEHTKGVILTPAQFSMKMQFFQSVQVQTGSIYPENLIDFSGFYKHVEKYYMIKFGVGVLYDKEGVFIKYVH